ncbi:MAG: hypothetical protein WD648_15775 [Planctomycetaceae bacterium]
MEGSRGPKRRRAKVGRDWRQSLATALWSGLILLAAVLFSQKMAGAFLPPVSPASACLVATLAMAPSLLAWSLWAPIGIGRTRPAVRWRMGAITLLSPLGLGIALLPTGFGFGHWYLGALLAVSCVGVILLSNSDFFAAESMAYAATSSKSPVFSQALNAESPSPLAGQRRAQPSGEGRGGGADGTRGRGDAETRRQERRVGETHHERLLALDGWLHPPYFWQQLTRTSSPQNGDVLQGSVTVRFEPGQRQANVHIPFVPPFSAIPTIECAALDGCDMRLKVGTLQTFGIRIEAKRSGDCELSEAAEIGFSAAVAASQANAA